MFKYLVPSVYKRILFHVRRSKVSYVVNGNWMVTEVFILYMHASVLRSEAEASAVRNRSRLNQVVLSSGIYREPVQTSAVNICSVSPVHVLSFLCWKLNKSLEVSFVTRRASLKPRAQFFALILDHHIQAAHELREFGFTRIISLDVFLGRAVKNLQLNGGSFESKHNYLYLSWHVSAFALSHLQFTRYVNEETIQCES